jgi:hypothetical protein
MIHDYEDFLYEGIFIKNFNERLEQIDNLMFELRDIMGKISALWLNGNRTNINYFNKSHNLHIKISSIFKDILLKYKKNLTQEQVNELVNKWVIFEKMFISYSYRSTNTELKNIYMKKIENANSFLYQLELLKKLGMNVEGFEIYGPDNRINVYVIGQKGNFSCLERESERNDRKNKSLEKHKDVDPLGEEDWSDVDNTKESIMWFNDDGTTYEEEDEIDEDPNLICVGDKVRVNGRTQIPGLENREVFFRNSIGEVIRIFTHDMQRYKVLFCQIDPDNGKNIDITVKFKGRYDLLPSRFSEHRDCILFHNMYKKKNKKTGEFSNQYSNNYITIEKI